MPANHTRFIYEGPFPPREPGMLPLQKITDTDTGGMIAIYDDNLERGERTAKLLAAAPELLAALEALLKSGEETNYAFYAVGNAKALKAAFHGQKELLHLARNVIANAKGQP